MRFTRQYIQNIKEVGREYDSRNHELLTQAGFIDQTASGIYTLLPPALKVLAKIENIVRKGMEKLDAEEIIMPLLQPKALWEQSKRWDSVDVLFKVKSRYDAEYGLSCTAEEVVSSLAKKYITSYRDLPLALYQINTKFRDEARAKSGILRGREFRMKDLYSFHTDNEDFEAFYNKAIEVYLEIFAECGLDDIKITEASGGDFSKKNSHEFNVLTPAGELDLLYCTTSNAAKNTEVVKDPANPGIECEGEIKESKAIEVGNIFDLETKFSQAYDIKYVDQYGKKHLVKMGCYGIGTSRLMGAIVEAHNDKDGIIWPLNVRPFDAHLVNLVRDDSAYADVVYRTLTAEGFDVLYDDRMGTSAGEKLAVADLVGVPVRLIVSPKTEKNVEWKLRDQEKTHLLSVPETIKGLQELYS